MEGVLRGNAGGHFHLNLGIWHIFWGWSYEENAKNTELCTKKRKNKPIGTKYDPFVKK